MKAVNLIPVHERRGGGGVGKSGGAVYALIGVLALLVIGVTALTMTSKTIDDREAQLVSLRQQVAAEQERIRQLDGYAAFRSLREKRVQTVTSLASSRFDWGAALHEVARVTPSNVWLTQLTATSAPGVNVGGGVAGGLRSALPVPAIELSGCTTSQPAVARTMAAMRRISGVLRVSLASSEKSDLGGGSGSGGSDCRHGRQKFPQFAMVIFFQPVTATAAPGAATTTPAATTTGQLNGNQTAKDASVTQEGTK